jgi:predicted RNA binding protein YcfA (HicA-like mRNA interferase family)
MKPQIWNQLKNKTADDLIQALEKDGAAKVGSRGSAQFYRLKSGCKIAIHYHPHFGNTFDSACVPRIGF